MNGYEFVTRSDLKRLRTLLENIKSHKTAKILNNECRNAEKEKAAKGSVIQIDRVLRNIEDTFKEPKNKPEKSNYGKIPEEDIKTIHVQLKNWKDKITREIEEGQYASKFEGDQARRTVHELNKIIQPVTQAIARKKKKNDIRTHVGETSLASDGKTVITISYWYNDNNVTVKFPDGRELPHCTYKRFKNGKIETHQMYVERKYGKDE